jgi:hypothetical protein
MRVAESSRLTRIGETKRAGRQIPYDKNLYPLAGSAPMALCSEPCYWTMRLVPAAMSDAICWKIAVRLVGLGSG